jgi:hypothetical protein
MSEDSKREGMKLVAHDARTGGDEDRGELCVEIWDDSGRVPHRTQNPRLDNRRSRNDLSA